MPGESRPAVRSDVHARGIAWRPTTGMEARQPDGDESSGLLSGCGVVASGDQQIAYLGGFISSHCGLRLPRDSADAYCARLTAARRGRGLPRVTNGQARGRIGEGAARLWLASPLIRALGMTDKHAVRAAPKPIAGSGTKSRRPG